MNDIRIKNNIEQNNQISSESVIKEKLNNLNQNKKSVLNKEIKELIEKQAPELDTDELIKVLDDINSSIDDKEVKLSYNKDIDRIIITVVNKYKNEIIKEYPCDALQKLALNVKEMRGLLFDKKV